MISRQTVIEKLTQIKPLLMKTYKVRSLALFGSYARGEQTERSDIDILVDVDSSLGLEFVTLAETIEKELGVSVDLVSSRALKPHYKVVVQAESIYV
jgi:predicted nucleotidyltransferase